MWVRRILPEMSKKKLLGSNEVCVGSLFHFKILFGIKGKLFELRLFSEAPEKST